MPVVKLTSALLSAIPAIAMFAGVTIGLWRQPSARMTAASQHFAAGLVFAAVASELLPDLLEPQRSTTAVVLGFAFGVGLMITLKWLVGGHDDGDEHNHGTGHADDPQRVPTRTPASNAERTALLDGVTPSASAAFMTTATATATAGALDNPMASADQGHSHGPDHNSPRLKLTITGADTQLHASAPALPWGLVTGVAVDVFVDGTLVGIAFNSGSSANADPNVTSDHMSGGDDDVRRGAVLAFALGFEILFLGLSMCASLRARGATASKTLAVGIGCALLVVFGVVVGSAVMQAVSGAVMDAFLSFGVSALLWLIEEELMKEAHEPSVGDKEPTVVTVCFFAGFLAVVLLRRLVE